jgi:hypothetical protein
VTVRVAGFAFGGIAEEARDIGVPFDVSLLCEVQVAAVGLRLAREGVFQVLVGSGAV